MFRKLSNWNKNTRIPKDTYNKISKELFKNQITARRV